MVRQNIILRPVYNRPEMLFLSMEYEITARDFFGDTSQMKTLFVVEHGAPDSIFQLIERYPFSKEVIKRTGKFGLTPNILEGMKAAFSITSDFVLYIEDDVLIHRTYFKYMKELMKLFTFDTFSILSPFNQDDKGDVSKVYKGHHYAALAPLINKKFFEELVRQCASDVYYGDRYRFILAVNERYKDNPLYKYKNSSAHNEQAGLINRLVDIAAIEKDMWVIMPEVNRQMHIGYYGKNRPGGIIPGGTFEERVDSLRGIIKSADTMYEMSATKQYNDYRVFSPKLEKWDGKLYAR